MVTLIRWSIGMSVALVLGAVVTELFVRALRSCFNISIPPSQRAVPAWLVGSIERLFFTVVVAFNISGTAVAMIGWITVKMVTNWNRPGCSGPEFAPVALTALLGGLVSMFFALIGGLICSGNIHL